MGCPPIIQRATLIMFTGTVSSCFVESFGTISGIRLASQKKRKMKKSTKFECTVHNCLDLNLESSALVIYVLCVGASICRVGKYACN